MNLEIIGKVAQLGQRATGEGRNGVWVKQELIIDTDDQYPKKVCLMCWGERADEAKTFHPGEQIKASINIESREYNGKWFTDVKVWKFDKVNGQSPSNPPENPYPAMDTPPVESFEDDLPF